MSLNPTKLSAFYKILGKKLIIFTRVLSNYEIESLNDFLLGTYLRAIRKLRKAQGGGFSPSVMDSSQVILNQHME